MGKTDFRVDYLNDKISELISKCEHKTLATWADDCAERVLAYFEEKYLITATFELLLNL